MPFDWERHREEAIRLFKTEGQTQRAVEHYFQTQYSFGPSTRKWKAMWKYWGVSKYRDRAAKPHARRVAARTAGARNRVPNVAQPVHATEATSDHSLNDPSRGASNEGIYQRLLAAQDKEEEWDDIFQQCSFVNGEESLLHYVARVTHDYFLIRDIIHFMGKNNQPLGILDANGRTALEIAIRVDNFNLTLPLLEADSSHLSLELPNETLLHLGIRYASDDVCEELIDRAEDLNKKDAYGWTPLDVAILLSRRSVLHHLLEAGTKAESDERLVVLFDRCHLQAKDCVDVLEHAFLKHKSSDEAIVSCRKIAYRLPGNVGSRYDSTGERHLGLLKHILQRYPEILEGESYKEENLFPAFQRFVGRWNHFHHDVQSVTADCLDVLLQRGFKPCSGGRYPYTNEAITEYPGVSYFYVKACVETCDIAMFGQGLFHLLNLLLEDPPVKVSGQPRPGWHRWWSGSEGSAKLASLLETLLDRGYVNRDIDLLGYVLLKVSDEHIEQKVQLVKTLLSKGHSLMNQCFLDLLTRPSSTNRWQLAENLMAVDIAKGLLEEWVGRPSNIWIDSVASIDLLDVYLNEQNLEDDRDYDFQSYLTEYTDRPRILEQCVLHVYTKAMIRGLNVTSADSQPTLMKVLSVRRSLGLPDLDLKLDSNGVLTLPDA